MRKFRTQCFRMLLIFIACSLPFTKSFASHLVGSDFAYALVDSTGGIYHYRVTLTTYADIAHGQPASIAEDDPAFISIYTGAGTLFQKDTEAYATTNAPVPTYSYCTCGSSSSSILFLRKTFARDYYLPGSATGYTLVYQRCCRNSTLTNILTPGSVGVTYTCSIPPSAIATNNNSAIFSHQPPSEVCINSPFSIDLSATDADGDSLSYRICDLYEGASAMDIKPIAPPPPYASANFASPLNYSSPMNCSVPVQIDAVTGQLTGVPNVLGVYALGIGCDEWRNGVLINTVRKEFEIAVTSFSGATFHPVAGYDTSLVIGESMSFHASGCASYLWRPATFLSDSTVANPSATFPAAGTFTYVLHGVSDSGCIGTDTIAVTVYAYSAIILPTAFTPNNDGRNDRLQPIPMHNSMLKNFKVFSKSGKTLFSDMGGWDGSYNGQPQEMGTYLWEAIYEDNNGVIRKVTGNSQLIR